MKRLSLLAGLLLVLATAADAAPSRWIGTWGGAPSPSNMNSPSFANETVRQVVKISAGGERVRVRFTNEYGTRPLGIGGARIAMAGPDGTALPGTDKPLTFNGKAAVTVPPGAPMLSDPVDMVLPALASLSISLYLPGETGACTCHVLGVQQAWVSDVGDFTARAFTPKRTITQRPFLSGVEVEPRRAGKTIVTFGDSLTDGYRSTQNANARWPDVLAARLNARGGSATWGVVNAAISGNRVLSPGQGEAGLTRFDRDVLSVPGVTHVVVFEGVNDVGMGSRSGGVPSADMMINGYRQLIARAHARGLMIYGATIAPYEGAAYYSAEGEAVRQQVNAWMRTSGAFDAVLDFDAVWRDPARPTRMKEALQAGDWLHGNDAGYKALADSVDLRLFR